MSVSNLTNTKWVIKSEPTISSNLSCNINFTSGSQDWTSIELDQYDGLSYHNTTLGIGDWVYTNSWVDVAYRIIKITGGNDVTNSSLIQWLEANATQVSVVDLTGTKWVLNSGPYTRPNFSYNINFTSNSSNFTSFSGNYDIYGSHLKYDNSYVYERLSWSSENYRIISITNGNDVSNPNLLVWLNNNATYIFIEDLTNTTWVFKEDLVWGDAQYAINFTSNNLSFKGIKYEVYSADIDRLFYINTDDSELKVCEYDADTAAYWTWIDNSYKTIEISNGTDATNLFLIADLIKSAILQEPITPTKTFDLSTLQLSAGTHTIQIKARASGYKDSNFSNSVSYTKPATYDVEFVLMSDTNGSAMSHFEYDNKKNGRYYENGAEHFYVNGEEVQVQAGEVEIGGLTIGPDYYVKGTLHVPQNQTTTITIYVDSQDASDEFGGDVTISPHGSWNRNNRTLTITGNGWFYIYAVD